MLAAKREYGTKFGENSKVVKTYRDDGRSLKCLEKPHLTVLSGVSDTRVSRIAGAPLFRRNSNISDVAGGRSTPRPFSLLDRKLAS